MYYCSCERECELSDIQTAAYRCEHSSSSAPGQCLSGGLSLCPGRDSTKSDFIWGTGRYNVIFEILPQDYIYNLKPTYFLSRNPNNIFFTYIYVLLLLFLLIFFCVFAIFNFKVHIFNFRLQVLGNIWQIFMNVTKTGKKLLMYLWAYLLRLDKSMNAHVNLVI